MHVLRQLDVHPKVREEADILVRTFSGAIGKYNRGIIARRTSTPSMPALMLAAGENGARGLSCESNRDIHVPVHQIILVAMLSNEQ
jgi:hypothetical protein